MSIREFIENKKGQAYSYFLSNYQTILPTSVAPYLSSVIIENTVTRFLPDPMKLSLKVKASAAITYYVAKCHDSLAATDSVSSMIFGGISYLPFKVALYTTKLAKCLVDNAFYMGLGFGGATIVSYSTSCLMDKLLGRVEEKLAEASCIMALADDASNLPENIQVLTNKKAQLEYIKYYIDGASSSLLEITKFFILLHSSTKTEEPAKKFVNKTEEVLEKVDKVDVLEQKLTEEKELRSKEVKLREELEQKVATQSEQLSGQAGQLLTQAQQLEIQSKQLEAQGRLREELEQKLTEQGEQIVAQSKQLLSQGEQLTSKDNLDAKQKVAVLQFAYNAIAQYKNLKELHLQEIKALSKLVESHMKQKGTEDSLSVGIGKANTVINAIYCVNAVCKFLNATGALGNSKVNKAAKLISIATELTTSDNRDFSQVISNFLANQEGLQNLPEAGYDFMQMLGNFSNHSSPDGHDRH